MNSFNNSSDFHLRFSSYKKFLGILTMSMCITFFLHAPSAHATVISVNEYVDELNTDGDCSLREAIHAANHDIVVDACLAGAGTDEVQLGKGTYVLSITGSYDDTNLTGDLDIWTQMSIIGSTDSNGNPTTVIDAGLIDAAIHSGAGSHLTVKNLIVTNASPISGSTTAWYDTGAIRNVDGVLLIDNSEVMSNPKFGISSVISTSTSTTPLPSLTVTNSVVELNNHGGIMCEFGSQTISNTQIQNNNRYGTYTEECTSVITDVVVDGNTGYGGMVLEADGVNTLTRVTVKNNSGAYYGTGGGIIADQSYLTITDSTIEANTGRYGGLTLSSMRNADIDDTKIQYNTATDQGGGVAILGTFLSGSGSTISMNEVSILYNNAENGGGIAITPDYYAEHRSRPVESVEILRSVVAYNEAVDTGGGLYTISAADFHVQNSTISNNSAGNSASAIYSDTYDRSISPTVGYSLYDGVTIGNQGTSSVVYKSGTIDIKGTIIAGINACLSTGSGTLTSLGFNVEKSASCNMTLATDQPNAIPGLSPLAYNGGTTMTHALLSFSSAIDVVPSSSTWLATDQRGITRPQDGNGNGRVAMDAGAFEIGSKSEK